MSRTIPKPIVSWETVAQLSDPLREPTRERLRRLRTRSGISNGVLVRPRRSGRNAGSAVYYSALTALSAQAAESGADEPARRLGEAGAVLEERFAGRLRGFLASHPVQDLATAPFYPELVDATRRSLSKVGVTLSFTSGKVREIEGETALIESDRDGRSVLLEVGSAMIKAAGLAVGDYVWISRRFIGPSAVTTLMPAVADSEARRSEPTGSDGQEDRSEEMSDQEYEAALAREFSHGPGRRPTRAQSRRLREGASNRPTHRISLVG